MSDAVVVAEAKIEHAKENGFDLLPQAMQEAIQKMNKEGVSSHLLAEIALSTHDITVASENQDQVLAAVLFINKTGRGMHDAHDYRKIFFENMRQANPELMKLHDLKFDRHQSPDMVY